jgi:transcriptional regulator with XRE-family HTH domain
MTDPNALASRARTVGTLIHEARLAAAKDVSDCGQIIGVTPEVFELYESGEKSISLPELENVSYMLNVPLEHFWDGFPAAAEESEKKATDLARLLSIRHRMIGTLLRQARLDANLSLEDVAQRGQVEINQLEAYELGQEPVPLPELEVLSGVLHRSIREFHDRHGPVGVWNAQQRALRDFLAMPLEMQLFVSKPVNRPYLDLAIRLSDMSVERLRAVAEGLLEITY